MLAKKYRLSAKPIPQKAKTIFRGTHLTIKTTPNNLLYNRFRIIIGRAKMKLSTERNFLRRTIYNYLKEQEVTKKTKNGTGHDFIFFINHPPKKSERLGILRELKEDGLPI